MLRVKLRIRSVVVGFWIRLFEEVVDLKDGRVGDDELVDPVEVLGHRVRSRGLSESVPTHIQLEGDKRLRQPVAKARRTVASVGEGQVGAAEILDGSVIADGEPGDQRPDQGSDVELVVSNAHAVPTSFGSSLSGGPSLVNRFSYRVEEGWIRCTVGPLQPELE